MTRVVKVGGEAVREPERFASDVAHLAANGERVILVHGGSVVIDETLDALGIDPRYVETPDGVVSRFTDSDTMDAVTMATQLVNTEWVTAFRNAGVDAVGLAGVDGVATGDRKSAVRIVENGRKRIERGDHAGTIEQVDDALLETLLADGRVPVVSVPIYATDDGLEGAAVNADADRLAAAVAGAVGERLLLSTDTGGVYTDPDDPESLIESVTSRDELTALHDAAEGFMSRKVMAAERALREGCSEVVIGDATLRDPIVAADAGHGTVVSETALEVVA
jgi:N-acetylglutamate kinase (EC 2.7.2.8)/N2-acetyl-L-aminoadipate kinase (EC 2.7.2.-)